MNETLPHLFSQEKAVSNDPLLRPLLNSIKDIAIFIIDVNGHILNWYEGATNIKGYHGDEVIGKHISIFYTKEDLDKNEPENNLQRASQDGSFETEGWRVRKDGSKFWADVLITAIYNGGILQGFTKVTRDFSLHKKAKDDIEQSLQKEKELNEMKSNFLSIASHEFKTPLSTILSSASLLAKYTLSEDQDKRDRHIQRIRSSVKDLISILEEFLSLEKIEEGKSVPKKESFNITILIDRIKTELTQILKQDQTIEYSHDGNEEIYSDPDYIKHILYNLVSNASKYSDENKSCIIKTSVTDGVLKLTVKDHGIGISSVDQQNLFERFFRASNTGNIKGTGLGLHIVKRYVELLGGTIEVKSILGKGSEFIVLLPYVQ